ncbi:MAG: anti-sigma factor antagonist [Christensenellaceae bacterium]|nr:anti-sigma factor antagonist [Christensenellaceae bacterium]
MGILISRSGNTVVARLEGEIDHHYAEGLRNKLDAAIADEYVSELVLDLGSVVFMDSSGLGVVLGRYKTLAARGGRLSIINASKRVERILRMGGIYTLIERNDRRTRA